MTHWRHRRRHSYVALIWLILQTFLWLGVGIYSTELLGALSTVIGFSYSVCIGVLGAYYGTSSLQDKIDGMKR